LTNLGHTFLDISADALEGNVLKQNRKTSIQSPNTLQHDNYFVWGGRVKKNNVLNPSPGGTIAKPDNLIVVNPLFINKDGSPSVLYCACSVEPVRDKKDGSTFNVQISLNMKK
jgi:hypothetical protein